MSNCTKQYDDDFKVQAVDLLRTSAKPLAQIARDLGVSVATLRRRKQRLLGGTPGPVEDQEPESKEKEALFEEIRQLHRQNAYLERQREILTESRGHFGRGVRTLYEVMDRMGKDYSIKTLCGAFELSAGGYFDHLKGACGTRDRANQELVAVVLPWKLDSEIS